MRTTLTLDSDVIALIREEMARSRQPFKQVVNRALRLGLRAGTPAERRERFRVKAHPFQFRPGIDSDRLNQLVDELETEALAGKYRAQARGE